jgi:Arc-like DNA binding domain
MSEPQHWQVRRRAFNLFLSPEEFVLIREAAERQDRSMQREIRCRLMKTFEKEELKA